MVEDFFNVNQLKLCIRQWNPIQTPSRGLVFILHGWLDQSAAWDPVAQELKDQNYHVIVPDHRGHGKSEHVPKSTHYHFPDYVADILALHRHFNDVPIHLIGHSMGGTIASIYSALFPQKVHSLTLIEGLGPAQESPIQAKERYKKHLIQRTQPHPHRHFAHPKEAAERYIQRFPKISLTRAKYLSSRILESTPQGWRWRYDPCHKDKAAISFSLERHLHILSCIQCPTFLINGSDSPYKNWIDIAPRKAALKNICGDYLLASGHSPHMENTRELCALLVKILQYNL